jgi:hypothetical protein
MEHTYLPKYWETPSPLQPRGTKAMIKQKKSISLVYAEDMIRGPNRIFTLQTTLLSFWKSCGATLWFTKCLCNNV